MQHCYSAHTKCPAKGLAWVLCCDSYCIWAARAHKLKNSRKHKFKWHWSGASPTPDDMIEALLQRHSTYTHCSSTLVFPSLRAVVGEMCTSWLVRHGMDAIWPLTLLFSIKPGPPLPSSDTVPHANFTLWERLCQGCKTGRCYYSA